MVETPDIKDRDSLEAWLRDQPREVSIWIASRGAARVLPDWWQEVLSEDWANAKRVTALPVLRDILISSFAAFAASDAIKSAAANAAGSVFSASLTTADGDTFVTSDSNIVRVDVGSDIAHVANDIAFKAAEAARDAARAATAVSTACPAFSAASAAAVSAAASNADTWHAIRTDAEQVANGTFPDALPLWPGGRGPLAEKWRGIKWQVKNSEGSEDWQFWIDWYAAQLAGRTMLPDPARTWEMLEQIALIDPETWDAGPEVVNPRIREIWELYRLRSEVAALQAEKEAFLAARASQAQRSHNQPPEGLVDDQPEVARQITIVWDSLDEARDELEQDTPDKGRLRAIAERLGAALNAIVQYCGKVADTAVMSAARVGGGAVGTAALDHVVNNGRLMQFAKDLLSYAIG